LLPASEGEEALARTAIPIQPFAQRGWCEPLSKGQVVHSSGQPDGVSSPSPGLDQLRFFLCPLRPVFLGFCCVFGCVFMCVALLHALYPIDCRSGRLFRLNYFMADGRCGRFHGPSPPHLCLPSMPPMPCMLSLSFRHAALPEAAAATTTGSPSLSTFGS